MISLRCMAAVFRETAFRAAVFQAAVFSAALCCAAALSGILPLTAARAQVASPRSGVSDERTSGAETLRVTLDGCLDRAVAEGEEMREARVTRSVAHARYLQARSTALPQLTFSGLYTRQIESIFEGGGRDGFEEFEPDTNASIPQRVRDLEKALPGSGFFAVSELLSSSSFASKNSWNAALNLRQKLTQGGQIWASIAAARHALDAARLMERDREAEVVLQVREAYLDALVADRGLRIRELGMEQARTHAERVRVRQGNGSASEFELLQSEVGLDNQVPLVRQALLGRDLAYAELRRLCNLPEEKPLILESRLLQDEREPPEPTDVDTAGLVETALRNSGLIALENALQAREHAVTVAASERYPEISAFANLSQQAYPGDTFPVRRDWRARHQCRGERVLGAVRRFSHQRRDRGGPRQRGARPASISRGPGSWFGWPSCRVAWSWTAPPRTFMRAPARWSWPSGRWSWPICGTRKAPGAFSKSPTRGSPGRSRNRTKHRPGGIISRRWPCWSGTRVDRSSAGGG